MKIDFFKAATAYTTQSAQTSKTAQSVESAKTKETDKSTEQANKQDRIELSPRAKKLASEWASKTAIAADITKTDSAKLEKIRAMVTKGEYNVSSEKIADAILGKIE